MQLDWQGLEAAQCAYDRRLELLSRFDSTGPMRERLAVVAAIRAYLQVTHQLPPEAVLEGDVLPPVHAEPQVLPPVRVGEPEAMPVIGGATVADPPAWPRGDTFVFEPGE
ncbi:MAG: hypothetical protein U1E46_01155 [Hyphomicrobiales bacterium]